MGHGWRCPPRAWFDPASVIARLAGRGLLERYAVGPLTLADVENAVTDRTKARRHAFLSGNPGGGPLPAYYSTLKRRYDELTDYFERRECAGEPRLSDRQVLILGMQETAEEHPDASRADGWHGG